MIREATPTLSKKRGWLLGSVLLLLVSLLLVVPNPGCSANLSEEEVVKRQQAQFGALNERLALSAKLSAFAFAEGEGAPAGSSRSVTAFFMKEKPGGMTIAGFRIFMGKLQILDSKEGKWIDFRVQGSSIEVQEPGSEFVLSASRKGVMLNMVLTYTTIGTTYTFPVKGMKYFCGK